jgi:hypothetical protein
MTTEIAIMNKSAVALAADSAVTITTTGPEGRSHKVLNTANKLFALSKHAPVGLMIYGNAAMLGIPWETIVKMYREELGRREFDTVEQYSEDFFKYLDEFDVGEDLQEMYVEAVAKAWCQELRKQLDQWVKEQIQMGNGPVSEADVQTSLGDFIKTEYDRALEMGNKSSLPSNARTNLRRKYRKLVEQISDEVFGTLPLTSHMRSHLLTIAVNMAAFGPPNQSGIVIAGFGFKDLYPKCYDFDVSAVFAGKTIKKNLRGQEVSYQNPAVIMPFAQSDDVKTFMEGVGPSLDQFLRDVFTLMFNSKLPEKARDEVVAELGLNATQSKTLHTIIRDMCMGACDEAFKALDQKKRADYVEPVVQATGFLNKAELAAMAETLVNLVSFRKQVTMEAETVGGPIDVAIISKGDGFVWVKRKHYFPPELNHHFFSTIIER